MLRHATIAAVLLFAIVVPRTAAATSDIGPKRVANIECQPLSSVATPAGLTTADLAPTPAAAPLAGLEQIAERDLPPGADADPETVAALFTLEQHYAACLKAGDYGAMLTFFDESLREVVEDELAGSGADDSGTPVAWDPEVQIDTIALRCVRTYPGGYAAALLDWEIDGSIETNAVVYRDTGAGWVVLDEVSIFGQQGEGCGAAVASTHRIPNGPSINLRLEPSLDAPIVKALPPGTPLSYLGVDAPNDDPQDGSRWMQFTTPDGDTGWIRESNVEELTP